LLFVAAVRPAITNPRAVPVTGRDDQLPAVLSSRLAPEALRARFAAPPAWQVERQGDAAGMGASQLTPAAVLVPLVLRAGQLTVLLTERTATLRQHAGQISFPGGRQDAADADITATALREAEEEVGVAAAHIEVIGQLPVYHTVTHYAVTPVVGLVQPAFDLQTQASEVAHAFEVPLAFLMNPAHHQRHSFEFAGQRRDFLSMPWVDAQGREHFIWGATAAMLRNLYRFLSA
jgi:8-oxo-dGTP pyrophosphatase MutT (NUDIX family)